MALKTKKAAIMCGITGIISKRKVDKNILIKMTQSLYHRGPDASGYFIKDNVGLGMRRLSIIDLETGNQPIYNEGKSVVVICNGELYNYKELKNELIKKGHKFYTKTDVEVIPHLYEEYGEDFVNYLNGMFAIAVWDAKRKKLILTRDRLGIKPLFYMIYNGDLIFGSEIKSVLIFLKHRFEIDKQSIYDYFSFKFIPEPKTIYKNIFHLPAGYSLIFKNSNIRLKKYWKLTFNLEDRITEEKAKEQFSELFEDAVKKRLISDVPLGVLLSGGIDSTSVLTFISRISSDRIKTFTIGFKEKEWDESKDAELIANHFNAEHHSKILKPENIKELVPKLINHFDEPFGDSSILPTYYVSKMAREYVKVALAGDGGDELFAGYTIYQGLLFAQKYKKLPDFLKKEFIPYNLNFLLNTSKGNLRYFFERLNRIVNDSLLPFSKFYTNKLSVFKTDDIFPLFHKNFLRTIDINSSWYINNITDNFIVDDIVKLSYLDLRFHLLNDMLVKVDRMSMLNSLEVRVPFLDHRVVEFAFNLPLNLKIKNFTRKYLIKKILKGKVPQQILRKKKKGFSIPMRIWFKGNLADLLEEYINSYNISIINKNYVNDLIKIHKGGRADVGEKLWLLLVFYEWVKAQGINI